MKFTNKVTRNRYDFESIESFVTRKNISRYFPIIQNVNLHLGLHILRNIHNDPYFRRFKKKKISIITAWNFLSFFLFLFLFSIEQIFLKNIHYFVSFLFRFFFIFFPYLSFLQNMLVSYCIYETNTRDFYAFTIFYSHPSW